MGTRFEFGVGIDIESVSRFDLNDLKRNPSFYKKVFTSREIRYCKERACPGEHFAARFAAKEAVFKAFSDLGESPLEFGKIEIIGGGRGSPAAVVNVPPLKKSYEIKISLAHSGGMAIACALIVRTGPVEET